MEEKKPQEQHISCEEIIENLKAQFPTVQFLPGTVGFVIKRGERMVAFPYDVFNDPNFRTVLINTITLLEVGNGTIHTRE